MSTFTRLLARTLASALPWFVCVPAAVAASDVPKARASDTLATRACAALAARVDALQDARFVLLRSFDHASGSGPPENPALATAAFAYDNALAAIALVACDRPGQARRIGDALLLAANDGRLRNTYLAGAQTGAPPPNGWWSAAESKWLQDPYQTGIATGNAAWVALALLTLAERFDERRYTQGAERIATWVVEKLGDASGSAGFFGGLHGFDGKETRLTWKSTEHHADLVAAFSWLARASGSERWAPASKQARQYLASQYETTGGRFIVGSLPDGRGANFAMSGLDAQLWPQLLPDADPRWRAALAFAEKAHGVRAGFDFNDDRDGLWVEGTAQAALVYRLLGRSREYESCLAEIARHSSAGGFLFATREARISTGLAINPDSRSADLHYFRLPHLGATAWAVLAATGWNPFAGNRVPEGQARRASAAAR